MAAEAAAVDPVRASLAPERLAALVRDNYAFVWRLLRRLGLGQGDAESEAEP